MAKRKDKKKGDDKIVKRNVNDKIGYIPPDLCEWVSNRYDEEEPDQSIIDDVQKGKFLKQIEGMTNRAERNSRQVDELTLNLALFPSKFKKLESDTNDMTTYLNNILDQKEKECNNVQTVLTTLEEEFQLKKEAQEKELQAARKALENMKNDLLPVNLKLKESLNEKSHLRQLNSNLEANKADYKKEIEMKAIHHQAHIYEMEKESVRELFEIREQIPKWVKRVSDENMNMENGRMHRILNTYRLELGDLLKKYVGKPNQLARKAIEENELLTKSVETNALNIKLIVENTEAMMRTGDIDVHEMHDLASNVKENKVLLKSFMSSQSLAPNILQELKEKVKESQGLVSKLYESYETSKLEKFQVISQIRRLDQENFKLQTIIRSFQGMFQQLMLDSVEYESLLNNLKVASCLDIKTEENYESLVCCRLVDPYNIFQTKPIFRPPSRFE